MDMLADMFVYLEKAAAWKTFVQGKKMGTLGFAGAAGLSWGRVRHQGWEFDMHVGREPVARLKLLEDLSCRRAPQTAVHDLCHQRRMLSTLRLERDIMKTVVAHYAGVVLASRLSGGMCSTACDPTQHH